VSWYRAPSGAHDQIVVNCLTFAVLSCSCALSDERSGLYFVSHNPKTSSICTWIFTFYMLHMSNMSSIYTSPCQSRHGRADYALQFVAKATAAL
jgi:hypothetical protein